MDSKPQAKNLYKTVTVGVNRMFAAKIEDMIYDPDSND